MNKTSSELINLKKSIKLINQKLNKTQDDDIELFKLISLYKEKEILFTSIVKENTKLILAPKTENKNNYEIDWDKIEFYDGYVKIKINEVFYNFSLRESVQTIEYIKYISYFRDFPKIIVTLIDSKIVEVKNIQSIFKVINFLFFKNTFQSNTSIELNKLSTENTKINPYNKQSKNLFITESLKYLCEISTHELQIIPIPELILTPNKTIHESFLFPIKRKNFIYWVWESVHESKASYIFKTNIEYQMRVQNIFDFISGDTINKRLTLVIDKKVGDSLGLVKRIFHLEFNSWKEEVHNFID